MKAILTKYMGPTESRGSRVVAYTTDQRVSIPYDSSLDDYEVYEKAAHALMRKMGWSGRIVGGSYKNNWIFVFVPSGDGRDRSRARRSARRR